MEIVGLFEEGGVDAVVAKFDGKVHEVNLLEQLTNFPAEFKGWVVEGITEVAKGQTVGRVASVIPDPKDIINEAAIEQEFAREAVKKGGFIDGFIDGCPRRGRGGSHGSSGLLFEESVPKTKNVVAHHQSECVHEGMDRYIVTVVLVKVLRDEAECLVGGDVGVHRDCIGGEEASCGWEVKVGKGVLEFPAVLKIGALLFGNNLEFVVDPNSKCIGETPRIRHNGSCLQGLFMHLHGGIKDSKRSTGCLGKVSL